MSVKHLRPLAAIVIMLQSIGAFALDICVYDTLKVAALRGKVVYESNTAARDPVANAVVELHKFDYRGRVVAKAVADKDGRFNLGNVKDGEYTVYVEAPQNVSNIWFPIRLDKSHRRKAGQPEMVITLGLGIAGCRGSFVQYGKMSNFPSE
jgi:hypothetical protein